MLLAQTWTGASPGHAAKACNSTPPNASDCPSIGIAPSGLGPGHRISSEEPADCVRSVNKLHSHQVPGCGDRVTDGPTLGTPLRMLRIKQPCPGGKERGWRGRKLADSMPLRKSNLPTWCTFTSPLQGPTRQALCLCLLMPSGHCHQENLYVG